jgi:hypothetical protein
MALHLQFDFCSVPSLRFVPGMLISGGRRIHDRTRSVIPADPLPGCKHGRIPRSKAQLFVFPSRGSQIAEELRAPIVPRVVCLHRGDFHRSVFIQVANPVQAVYYFLAVMVVLNLVKWRARASVNTPAV